MDGEPWQASQLTEVITSSSNAITAAPSWATDANVYEYILGWLLWYLSHLFHVHLGISMSSTPWYRSQDCIIPEAGWDRISEMDQVNVTIKGNEA